jgi:hypothetical protein
MSTSSIPRSTGVAAVVAIVTAVALTGCGGSSTDDSTARVTAPSVSTSRTSPSEEPTAQELTAEESLRVNPPPPQRLVATRGDRQIELSWSAPPAVTVPHSYSDTVVEYRVYRSVDGRAELLLGTSRTLAFADTNPVPGVLRYAVSSVREHGVEGARTDAVTAPPAS